MASPDTIFHRRYGYGSPVMVQRGGGGGFGGVLLFLMAAGALVWFLQGSQTGNGLSLGALRWPTCLRYGSLRRHSLALGCWVVSALLRA